MRFLGRPRFELKRRELEVDLPEGAKVSDIVAGVSQGVGPSGEDVLVDRRRGGYLVLFSLNGNVVDPASPLSDGDEVTIFSPSAGGGGLGS